MKGVIHGAPAIGKSLVVRGIKEELGLDHINIGEILRNKNSSETNSYMDKGLLVPDNIINNIVEDEIKNYESFILDGYPRTVEQAEYLESLMAVDFVINLKTEMAKEDIFKLITGRRFCSCGEIYNIYALPPKEVGLCDECGSNLMEREKESPDVINQRLDIYFSNTPKIMQHYKSNGVNVFEKNVDNGIKEVKSEMVETIRQLI